MNALRIAFVAGTIALLTNSESNAQSNTQIEPENGYAVQALVWNMSKDQNTGQYYVSRGNYWRTAETFPTRQKAEEYKSFLFFLADNDFGKLLNELDFPNYVFVHGFDYRIVPLYSSAQLRPTRSILRR